MLPHDCMYSDSSTLLGNMKGNLLIAGYTCELFYTEFFNYCIAGNENLPQ